MTTRNITPAPSAPSTQSVGQGAQRLPTFFMAAFLMAALALLPEVAMAEPWDQGANWVLSALQNGFVRSVAVIVCIAVGLAALGGRIPWKWGIALIAGIVLIFGAPTIVDGIIAAVS